MFGILVKWFKAVGTDYIRVHQYSVLSSSTLKLITYKVQSYNFYKSVGLGVISMLVQTGLGAVSQ